MTEALPTLGMIGLGEMGGPIAGRLLAAGARVHVFDTSAPAVAAAVQQGATAAGSPREVGDAAEIVILSLPNAEVVLGVVGGDDGLLAGSACSAVVDLSTIGPEGAERLRVVLEGAGVGYLDAPVSGGPAGARSGGLTIMAAGDSGLFGRLQPVLEVLGSNVQHVDDVPGRGQLAKVINNLMSAAAIVITSEALALGVRGGLDPARLLSVVNASSGRNTASSDKFPKHVLPRTFDFGFRLSLMAKDVGLCLDEAQRAGTPMLLGSTVRQVVNLAGATLPPGSDCTEVARMIEAWSGVRIAGEAA